MTVLADALAVAKELSDADRAALAHELIASLDADNEVGASGAEEAWDAEVADRLDRHRRGEITLMDEDGARDVLGS